MITKIIQRIGKKNRGREKYPVDIAAVESSIHYQFRDKNLLLLALKHRSYQNGSPENGIESNERLEFLGDAVLDLITTEHLYSHFTDHDEGTLSKKKSVLVSRQVLGHITEQLGLGRYLLINKGEEKTGGRSRRSNLANLFEALLGAIYLDAGIEPSRKFVDTFVLKRSEEFLSTNTFFNYKSGLLEFAQSRGWGFPKYQVISEKGPDHDKKFVVVAKVNNKWSAKGSGRSKKRAEQQAAQNLLNKLASEKAEPSEHEKKKAFTEGNTLSEKD